MKIDDGNNLSKKDFYVKEITHKDAQDIIVSYHYAKSCSLMSIYRFGLFNKKHELVGACLWMPPTKLAALTVSEDWKKVLCLSRFAIKPNMPRNSASFFLSKCIKNIKQKMINRFHDTLNTMAPVLCLVSCV